MRQKREAGQTDTSFRRLWNERRQMPKLLHWSSLNKYKATSLILTPLIFFYNVYFILYKCSPILKNIQTQKLLRVFNFCLLAHDGYLITILTYVCAYIGNIDIATILTIVTFVAIVTIVVILTFITFVTDMSIVIIWTIVTIVTNITKVTIVTIGIIVTTVPIITIILIIYLCPVGSI